MEGLFKKLPVRRRELEKNIKREYGKVLNLLHAYACVSTRVRFSVKNTLAKKNAVVFTTNGNQTTKENIANVYGAKTLPALIPLDLELEFEPSGPGRRTAGEDTNRIQVCGHVSRPVFGEGRQTPDRQMFFVNSRPCALPQIAKAFNEVYKSFNVAQSPFVFADFHMDTNAYDVNVSPDKRTVLLHDAGALIESLKQSLQKLFDSTDQTVPQSQVLGKLPVARQRSYPETPTVSAAKADVGSQQSVDAEDQSEGEQQKSPMNQQDRMKSLLGNIKARGTRPDEPSPTRTPSKQQFPVVPSPTGTRNAPAQEETHDHTAEEESSSDELFVGEKTPHGNTQTQHDDEPSTQSSQPQESTQDDFETPDAIQNAFDRMRPRRVPAEMATITIGDRTVTSMVGSGVPRKRSTTGDSTTRPARKRRIHTPSRPSIFGRMQDFAAPGSQMDVSQDSEGEDDDEDEDIEDEDQDEDQDEGDEGVEEEAEEVEEVESEVDEELEDAESFAPSDQDNASEAGEKDTKKAQEQPSDEGMDEDMNDEEKKKHEEAEVQRLIQAAENAAQANSHTRANKLHKGVSHRDSTVNLSTTINGSISRIQSQAEHLNNPTEQGNPSSQNEAEDTGLSQVAAEERLSLTVTKDDFARMRILGQFNLGFILATRSTESKDELFIIDQHASDEKINFERLQSSTVVQNQRLVHPKRLDLTAVEEEIVIENQIALEKNGFVIDVDDSGDEPIGRRCSLLSLPLSKEVVFDTRDLEELIVLLSERTSTSNTKTGSDIDIPRPSKVRKMFAMRACRSSIMIGKTLTHKQMERVVRNMGTIDKPWNCPHGRPTMRHLFSLRHWEEWNEYEHAPAYGHDGNSDEDGNESLSRLDIWKEYLQGLAAESG